VTFNVYQLSRVTPEKLGALLAEKGADVAALQETPCTLLQRIAAAAGLPYYVGCTLGQVAVLSRWPVIAADATGLCVHMDHTDRALLRVLIETPWGAQLRLATAHLDHVLEPDRMVQWDVADHILRGRELQRGGSALPTDVVVGVVPGGFSYAPGDIIPQPGVEVARQYGPASALTPGGWIVVGDYNALSRGDYTQSQWEGIASTRRISRWEEPVSELTDNMRAAGWCDVMDTAAVKPGERTKRKGEGTCRFHTRIDYIWLDERALTAWPPVPQSYEIFNREMVLSDHRAVSVRLRCAVASGDARR
jgi:endonuclease/exonuclease/phosphatase family metal-dependent hydrolase